MRFGGWQHVGWPRGPACGGLGGLILAPGVEKHGLGCVGSSARRASCWVGGGSGLSGRARLDQPLSPSGGGRSVPWVVWRACKPDRWHTHPAGHRLSLPTADCWCTLCYCVSSHSREKKPLQTVQKKAPRSAPGAHPPPSAQRATATGTLPRGCLSIRTASCGATRARSRGARSTGPTAPARRASMATCCATTSVWCDRRHGPAAACEPGALQQ